MLHKLIRRAAFLIALAVAVVSTGRAQDPAKDILADGDVKIAPPYMPAPETQPREGVPKGAMKSFVMDRKDSKIFPINEKLRNNPTRKISVYVPAQYVPGTE